jgi:hypothetical protein
MQIGVNRSVTYMLALSAGSVMVAAHDAVFYWHGAEPSSQVAEFWPVLFAVILVLWLEEDSKKYGNIYRPFEFGYLLLFLWLPYLPYYLWKTRGARGMVLLGYLFVLAFLSPLCELFIKVIQ